MSDEPAEPSPSTPEERNATPFWILVVFAVVVGGLILSAMFR